MLDDRKAPHDCADVTYPMKFRQTLHHLFIGAGSILAPGAAAAPTNSPLAAISDDFRAVGVAINNALQAAKKENGPPRPARQLEFEEITLAGRR